MAWEITDRFPVWGESGEMPPTGFLYEGGDQVNEKHLDALWNGIKGLEDDVQAALDDIDSNADGVVDRADIADTLPSGEIGDGLKGGDDTVISVEPADFAGDGVKDDGSDNIAVEPADFAGLFLSDDGADNLTVDISTHLQDDGSGSIEVTDDFILNTGDTMTGDFTIQSALFADQSTGDLDISGEFTEGASL